MTWTYDATQLDDGDATARLMQVRLLIGDTDTTDQKLQNEELQYFLATGSDDPTTAAYLALDSLVAKYSSMVDKRVGDLAISNSQKASAFARLRDALRLTGGVLPVPRAPSISASEKEAQYDDDDLMLPAFTIGGMDTQGQLYTRSNDQGLPP